MEEKNKKIFVSYKVTYQIVLMEEVVIGIDYFDLIQYYKYKYQNKHINKK